MFAAATGPAFSHAVSLTQALLLASPPPLRKKRTIVAASCNTSTRCAAAQDIEIVGTYDGRQGRAQELAAKLSAVEMPAKPARDPSQTCT